MQENNVNIRYFIFGEDLDKNAGLHNFFDENKSLLPEPVTIKYIGDLQEKNKFKVIDPSELPLVKANENLSYDHAYDLTDVDEEILKLVPVFPCEQNADGSYNKDYKTNRK